MLHMKDEDVSTTEERRQVQHGQLRLAREHHGWTQKELADLIDLPDPRTLRRWECGESSPSLRYRARLCKLFEMSAEELNLVQDNHAPDEKRFSQPSEVEGRDNPLQLLLPSAPDSWENHEKRNQPHPEPSQSIYEDDDFTSHHKMLMFPSPDRWNRQQLLNKVQVFWIKGILEQSFQETTYLPLQFCTRPDAVSNAWTEIIQQPDCSGHSLPHGTSIVHVYDNACGELLILGEPGSGKTLLLLELTRDLLSRAFANEAHPMPVVFNLSSWTPKWHSLATWLVEELSRKYQVPMRLSQEWVDNDRILPLLDGLDEVHPSYQKICADAITMYRRDHGLVPLVVCSRKEEYMNLPTRILLQQAIYIQPLTPCQVNDYIARVGNQSLALQAVLRADPHLQELVTTPFILSLLPSMYQTQAIDTLNGSETAEQRRNRFIATYVESMLKRRIREPVYTFQQSRRWLAYLAQQMKQHDQTEFSPEHVQLDWLPTRQMRRIYAGLLVGAQAAVCSSVLVGLAAALLTRSLIETVLITLCFALLIGVITGISGAISVERFAASKKRESRAGQMLLRLMLRSGGYIPWNHARFLDFATGCGLLHQTGKGYVFAHPFLLEYFANRFA